MNQNLLEGYYCHDKKTMKVKNWENFNTKKSTLTSSSLRFIKHYIHKEKELGKRKLGTSNTTEQLQWIVRECSNNGLTTGWSVSSTSCFKAQFGRRSKSLNTISSNSPRSLRILLPSGTLTVLVGAFFLLSWWLECQYLTPTIISMQQKSASPKTNTHSDLMKIEACKEHMIETQMQILKNNTILALQVHNVLLLTSPR